MITCKTCGDPAEFSFYDGHWRCSTCGAIFDSSGQYLECPASKLQKTFGMSREEALEQSKRNQEKARNIIYR